MNPGDVTEIGRTMLVIQRMPVPARRFGSTPTIIRGTGRRRVGAASAVEVTFAVIRVTTQLPAAPGAATPGIRRSTRGRVGRLRPLRARAAAGGFRTPDRSATRGGAAGVASATFSLGNGGVGLLPARWAHVC